MTRSCFLAALLSACLSIAGGCGGGSPRSSGGFAGAAFPPGLKARDFTLANQDGRAVSLSSTRGLVTVLAFLADRTADATLAAQQIRGALDELGHRGESVAVLLLSPPPSSPRRASGGARARSLLDATSLAGRAQYLSGTSASLRAAWHAYGVVLPSAGRRAFLASPTIVVLDRRGFERVGFALEQLTPEGLAHDIDTLLGR